MMHVCVCACVCVCMSPNQPTEVLSSFCSGTMPSPFFVNLSGTLCKALHVVHDQ